MSSFNNRGKKTAWTTWTDYDEVTDAFATLSSAPQSIEEAILQKLERFVVLLYDRTSNLHCVNASRKALFTQKGREIENIPPSHAALQQHVKRAAFKAGHIWGQLLIPNPEIPSPKD